jgi:hypothetical protein
MNKNGFVVMMDHFKWEKVAPIYPNVQADFSHYRLGPGAYAIMQKDRP